MKSSLTRFVPAFVVLTSFTVVSLHAQIIQDKPMPKTVTIKVDTEGQGQSIPPGLFGSFIEPIDTSLNHGLIAEILTNRSLESGLWDHAELEKMFLDQPALISSSDHSGLPLPWLPLHAIQGSRYALHVGDAANSWQSVEIMGLPNQTVGIMQRVYLPVQRTLSYKVSLYAKHLSGPERIMVSIRSRQNDQVLVSSFVTASAAHWTKYSTTLSIPQGAIRRLEAVNFSVSVKGDERIDVDQLSLMPSDAIGVSDPTAVAMARAMHLSQLRFGGNFSSAYNWRDGIGPMVRRPTRENIAWGIPEYNIFGTDEFLEFCRLVHTTPQFDLNMGTGTPQEAATWVRYIHAHYKGKIIYELGNELYGRWQVGYPTLSELAARTEAFSRVVRAVDPNAAIIATGLGPVRFTQWNAAQLSTPHGTFNNLSMHFIIGANHAVNRHASPGFLAEAAYATTWAVGPWFDRMQAQVNQAPGMANKVHFAITEWLFNSKGYGERNFTDESPSWLNEGGAVLAAGFFNTMLRHGSEIKIADMTGMMDFAGIWQKEGQVYASPAYYVFKMYSQLEGDSLLSVTSDSGTYAVTDGIRPFPDVSDVPYVDVIAARSKDGNTITVFCVNRSLTLAIPVRVNLGSFIPQATVSGKQIFSQSRYEENSAVEPDQVVPVPVTFSASAGQPITITLPHESVTMLRFHRK